MGRGDDLALGGRSQLCVGVSPPGTGAQLQGMEQM